VLLVCTLAIFMTFLFDLKILIVMKFFIRYEIKQMFLVFDTFNTFRNFLQFLLKFQLLFIILFVFLFIRRNSIFHNIF